jgi:hypothetical protein
MDTKSLNRQIAVATHEKLVQIPNEFKDLPLEARPKRGR